MSTRVARPRPRPLRRSLAYSDTDLTLDTATRLLLRAARHELRGELDRARDIYQKVAELDDLAAIALTRRGKVERALGDLASAVRSLTQALHHCVDDDEHSFAIFLELGDVHAQAGDYEEASYHYRRALVLEPGRVEVQRRLRGALHLRYSARQTA
ncbi:MAG: tetratricopeptide repeat protein [Sandaracinaceae bacterium]|nr:tetratricopeptide repeat protein [Sandaracinaceae bacterium]